MDSYTLLRDAHRALERSMRTRANGTRHARGCFNAQVNATWYECSPACKEANRVLIELHGWLQASRPVVPKLIVPT